MASVRRVGASLAVLVAALGVTAVAASPAAARSHAALIPVQGCPADFVTEPPVAPRRHAHAPADVVRPPGFRPTPGMALYGVASASVRHHGAGVGYETIAGPRGYRCSGLGFYEDDVSFATLQSPKHPTFALGARFGYGQGGFAALCSYLLAAGRTHDARAIAHEVGMTLRECREQTPNMPKGSHARAVRFSAQRTAPFAVVIHARAGSERICWPIGRGGKALRGHRTTTPTLSVAIVKYTSLHRLHSPQTLDCSLPAARRGTCVTAARAFAAENLVTSYGWGRKAAARAGRAVARAMR